jgi:acetyl esterase/lipase
VSTACRSVVLIVANHIVGRSPLRKSLPIPPAILKSGEKCELTPALVFGGDKDEWVPVELMRSFVADYKKAGGRAELQLYEGANHAFMTGKSAAPYAARGPDQLGWWKLSFQQHHRDSWSILFPGSRATASVRQEGV